MCDNTLTIESKALFAYIYSFAFPNKDVEINTRQAIFDLGISKTRYYKHRKLLIDRGLLSVEQQRDGNKYSDAVFSLGVNK